VLAKLVEGDPLNIHERCMQRMRSRAVLVSLDRLALRAMARIARFAMKYRGLPELELWIRAQIDDSIEDLIVEDREAERACIPSTSSENGPYGFVSEALGVEPALARRVCVVFNNLADVERRAFWAVVMEGKPIERCAAEGQGSLADMRAALHNALLRLSLLDDDDVTEH